MVTQPPRYVLIEPTDMDIVGAPLLCVGGLWRFCVVHRHSNRGHGPILHVPEVTAILANIGELVPYIIFSGMPEVLIILAMMSVFRFLREKPIPPFGEQARR
jgi:hypothetical protein